MAPRSTLIVSAATARSETYIKSLPAERSEKFRSNCRSIAKVCALLVSLRPPREPTSIAVSEEGQINFASFPAKSTLDNTYRGLLAIWRQAFAEITNASVLQSRLGMTKVEFAPSDLAPLDAGTRANVQIIAALLRETQARNNRLLQIIREKIPYDGDDGIESAPKLCAPTLLAPDIRTELAEWIGRLDNGASPFQLDDVGVKVTRRSPVGTTVMSRLLLDGLRGLVAKAN